MIHASRLRKFAFSGLGLSLTLAGALLILGLAPGSKMDLISNADAWIGRPMTPMSYAGVARRTVRRGAIYGGAVYGAAVVASTPVIVQSTTINQPAPAAASLVASLPPNCPADGNVFVCGGHTYQPMMQGSTVIYEVR